MVADAKYEVTLRRATDEIVKKQASVGIDIVSDGEFGKSSWSNDVLDRITGFEIRPNQLRPGNLRFSKTRHSCS